MKILLSALALLIISQPVFAAVEQQVALQDSYRDKIQRYLDNVYGEKKFLARVDVEITDPQYSVKYTQQSNPKLNNNKKKEKQVNILPGYPVIKNLGPGNMNSLPFDSVTSYRSPKVKSVMVNLLVDKSVPRGKIGRIKSDIAELLPVNSRLVKVESKSVDFFKPKKPSQAIDITSNPSELVTMDNIFRIATLALLLIFMIIYIVFQKKALSVESEKGGGGDGNANISVNSKVELPKGSGGGSGPSGSIKMSTAPPIKKYFDFITDENIDNLMYIIKREKFSVEHIAIMTAFLTPELAAKVLLELDIKNQAIIALSMLNQKMIDRVNIDKMEKHIQSSLECLVGGQKVFQEAFSFVSSDNKKKIMGLLGKSNPEGYKKFRSNITIFDDMKLLDDEEIKTILGEVNSDTLTVALAGAEKDVYQKIYSNMTESGKDMLSQYLELRGQTMSKDDIEKAQEEILLKAVKLEEENRIHLRDKIKV